MKSALKRIRLYEYALNEFEVKKMYWIQFMMKHQILLKFKPPIN